MENPEVYSYEEIEIELHQVLNFVLFKNSPILAMFLEYIVTETLQGRSKNIKEYNIAVNVLKRPASFNCNDDSIVRIHAGRLRRVLNLYYVTEGKNNKFHIDVPKGSYVPHFKWFSQDKVDSCSSSTTSSANDTNPMVAIFPFKCFSGKEEEVMFSIILSEEISSELSSFRDIATIGYYSAEMTSKISENIIEAGKSLKVDYIITGSVQFIDERIKIRVNLLIASSGQVMVTKTINKRIDSGMLEIQDEIINNFIGAIGGYYGLIFHGMNLASPIKASANMIMREGIYGYYKYQRSFSFSTFNTAVAALEKAVKMYPDSAEALAMLAELYLDGILLGIKTVDEPFEVACRFSAEALKIDPLSQHAWQTRAFLHLFKKEKEYCFHSALQCLKLNSNSTDITCGVGFVLVCAGYFEEGFQLIQKASRLSPDYPWFVNGGLCFYFIYKRDYLTALYWAEKMNTEETYWDPLLKTVCLSYIGKQFEAKKSLARLLELVPDAPVRMKEMIPCLILSNDLASHIVTALENTVLAYIEN
ncbi:hypothetical protein [Flavobacterium sp. LAR06]|uniref:tetratricopeptide repeat protein n=1 Tax=Flavobacterium sp. LAR06 TaxID=3064897 RepID=UPI0035BEDC14